jgi:hypothetical protein
MANQNQNIDMTKLKRLISGVGCGKETCVCRKGCGLSPTEDWSEVGHGKENGCDK